jgi:hypothetical protein
VDGKPSFEHIFRLTGFHLGAAGMGFFVAASIFAPKPRVPAAVSPRVAQILELRTQARAAASGAPTTGPSVGVGTAGAPGASPAASAVAGPPAAALARATELCKALAWPACDADSVRAMGQLP